MKNIQFLKDKGVDIDKSLELFGDINTYNDTIGEFLVGIHNKIKNLIDLMNKGDLQNYAIVVHSMKSDCKYFGFTKLANLAYEHEMKSKAGDLYYVTNHINDLIFETNNTIKLIQEYMNGEDEKESVEHLEEVNPDVYDKKTILVVDDSVTTREIEKSILEGAGYVVEDAFDGLDGLEKAKEKHYDLILADQEMPRMTGLVLLDNLRRLDHYKETPVIVVSTDQSRQTIEEFQRLKAGAIIAKSEFKRGKLLEAIKELMGEE